MKRLFLILLTFCIPFFLFCFSEIVFSATEEAISICKDTLLPSLFPFMILSSFISYSGTGLIISAIFSPLTKLLSLPKCTGGIWFTTFIGGFPSGAASICSMYDLNSIDRSFAEQIISCCVCSGPAFLIIAVGKILFNSYKIGLMLFVSQIISVIILTAIFCKSNNSQSNATQISLPISVAFVSAVNHSILSLLNIFAFVILFSILIEIMLHCFPQFSIAVSLLEITIGCKIISEQLNSSILPIAFLTGFGGISVCFQILSIAHHSGLSPKYFWTVRFLNGLLCSLICFVFLKIFPQANEVYYSSDAPVPFAVWSVNSVLGAVCFCAMLLSVMQKLDIYRKDFM